MEGKHGWTDGTEMNIPTSPLNFYWWGTIISLFISFNCIFSIFIPYSVFKKWTITTMALLAWWIGNGCKFTIGKELQSCNNSWFNFRQTQMIVNNRRTRFLSLLHKARPRLYSLNFQHPNSGILAVPDQRQHNRQLKYNGKSEWSMTSE